MEEEEEEEDVLGFDDYVPPPAEPEPAPEPAPAPEKVLSDYVPVLMSRYSLETGLIHGHFSGAPGTALANISDVWGMWIGEHVDGFTHYIDVTASPLKKAERPIVAEPTPGPAPWTWDITALPAGTVLTLSNEVGDVLEISDLSEPLTLTDAGTYRVEIQPPVPYAPTTYDLEVTDA